MNKELQVTIKAAKESGKILMKYYKKNLTTEKKSDKSPVTVADKHSERKIVSIIKKQFPSHNFFGEEFKYHKTESEFRWIIDPLDGTRQFIRGIPIFGNCIALEKNGEVIAGAICMPAMDLFAYASKGNGSFVNGKKSHVSMIEDISEAFVAFGNAENSYEQGYEKQFRQLISKSYSNRGYADTLGYIMLAQGSVDVVLDRPQPWDVAAPKIIVEEAGGIFSDFSGKTTIYSHCTVATNRKLHNDVLKILNK